LYLSINLENIITIGVMLMIWMLAVHLIGQFASVTFPGWVPGA